MSVEKGKNMVKQNALYKQTGQIQNLAIPLMALWPRTLDPLTGVKLSDLWMTSNNIFSRVSKIKRQRLDWLQIEARCSKKVVGIGHLHGCLETHVCRVRSKPHPPPHSKRSCNSKISFLSNTKKAYDILIGKHVQPNSCQFQFLWCCGGLHHTKPRIINAKIRHQGIVQASDSTNQRLDRLASCLGGQKDRGGYSWADGISLDHHEKQ